MRFIWLLHELLVEILILITFKLPFSIYVSDELFFLDYVYIELLLIYIFIEQVTNY